MKVAVFGDISTFQLFLLSSLIPSVFIYLWSLITGDIKVRLVHSSADITANVEGKCLPLLSEF